MKKEKTTIVVAGVLIGVIAAMLVFFGNPANMGFCIAASSVIPQVRSDFIPQQPYSTSVRRSSDLCWVHASCH